MKWRFTKNLELKVLAVIFATALWFFVAGQSSTEVGFFVPLGFYGIPKDMMMTSLPPGEIDVRVRGPKLVINNLSASQIKAELDLSDAREGMHRYIIRPSDVTVPTGVEVVRVRPRFVNIRLERIVKASIPVKPRLRGRPAKGYKVAAVRVSPENIEVVGLKKEIKPLKQFYTTRVDISGISESKNVEAKLVLGKREFNSISAESVRVVVVIEKIKQKQKQKKK